MKVFVKVIELIIRDMVDIDGIQFGFKPRKGTMGAVLIARQLQQRYLDLLDLGKAFDWVLREVVKWAMRKLSGDE